MKISVIKPPPYLIWLLIPALFALGLWLGGAAAPAGSSGAVPDIYTLLLRSAGLPGLEQTPVLTAASLPPEAPTEETLLVVAKARAKAETEETPQTEAKPQAVIYCTHTSEEYSGQSRRKGVAGGVLEAARSLAQALEEQGIAVILDETVHDGSYDSAYAHSLATLEEIAAEHPDIRLYIDVHRDSAIAGINTTLSAQGVDYAKMLLIVGSDEQLPHAGWEDNYAFARQLTEAANGLLPGIMREPRVYSARYNQHIGDRAILVEIGSTDNTQEEAERSGRVLAEAIAACL